MIDKVKIKAIIKQYADKGERLLEEAYENGDHASTTGYWDGYRDCANLLLRELDDIQEESQVCMYSTANYTDEDRKVLCDGCEEECKFNKKEEPVSEDLEQAIDTYLATYFGGEKEKQDWPYLKKMAIHFANWQKQQMEAYRIEHCKSLTNEQAGLEDNFVSSHVEKNNRIPTFIDAIEYGIEYGKQQMMKEAVDATVHIDAGGYPYIPQMELYDYEKDIPLAKEGDKYKVILIKEG